MKHITEIFCSAGVILSAVLLFALYGCKDEEIEGRSMGESVNRTVEEINSNIRAFQKLLEAQETDKVIKNCTKISNSTYKVELEDGNSFNVYTFITTPGELEGHAYSPIITARKSEGTYYWTLDGNFIEVSDKKLEVIAGEEPKINIDSEKYWTVTCGTDTWRIGQVENRTVKSVFSDVVLSKKGEVKFALRGDTPYIVLRKTSDEESPIQPTGTLRRPITPEHPAWFVHILWKSNPQAIIDLIPENIRPYVIFNIAITAQGIGDGSPVVEDAYELAKSYIRTCAENNVWCMLQATTGGYSHMDDVSNYSDFEGSAYEEFFQNYPNFLGFVYAEQGWGFGTSTSPSYQERLQHWSHLLRLSNEYGGYVVVSYLNPQQAYMSGVGMIKQSSEFAEACKMYHKNLIACEKYTQDYGCFDMESTSLGVFLSGFADNYGIRFDQAWHTENPWNGDMEYPVAAGAIPMIEHIMFTGQTVYDGPELVDRQCFFESNTVGTESGYVKRTWATFPQFKHIYQDLYRKIIDGDIHIMSRKEVIDRTKFVIVNDILPMERVPYDPGYSAPANLFRGLYLMDEDGIKEDHHLYFKKTGRYPAIPTVAELTDDLANSFEFQIDASQFITGSGWGDIRIKQAKFNEVFPEEYTSDGMFAGRYQNRWVAYNAYANIKTADIPFKYNTCEKMQLLFGKYSVAAINEYTDKVKFYLTNFREDNTQTTDVIKVYGSSSKPSNSYTNHVQGSTCSVSEEWKDGIYTLTVQHNGSVDITISCEGTATDRETEYTPSNVSSPNVPNTIKEYNGPRQYEAEYFEYQNIAEVVKYAPNRLGSLHYYTAMGYLDFGQDANAAVRSQISVNTADIYFIKVRYSAPITTIKTVDLYVNGKKVEDVPEFVQTGSEYAAWQTVSIPVSLEKGKNNIELKANASAAGTLYLDNIVVEN